MCGICGVISHAPLKEKTNPIIKICEKSEDRGKDAFGFYAFNLDGSPIADNMKEMLWKDPTHPTELFGKTKAELDLSRCGVFLAHTRAWTQGTASQNKNNHPFESEDFVFAHNGGCGSHIMLKKELKLEYDSDCDSPVILFAIQKRFDESGKRDLVGAISKGLEDVAQAGFSCWLVHKGTNTIFLFRNSNPCEWGNLPDGTLVFASTSDAIQAGFGAKVKTTSTDSLKIYEVRGNPGSPLSLEVVGEFPKENIKWTQKWNTSHGTGASRTSQAGETSQSGTGETTTNVALAQRMQLIGDKFKLDCHFIRRTDAHWVFTTNQPELIDIVNNLDAFKVMVLETISQGKNWVTMTVAEKRLGVFLDDIEEACYQAGMGERPAGAKFLSWLNHMGVKIKHHQSNKITFQATNPLAVRELKELGFVVNKNGTFEIAAKNEKKFKQRLEQLEHKHMGK